MLKLIFRIYVFLLISISTSSAYAIEEELFSVDLANNNKQAGLYVATSKSAVPTKLVVIVPGYPTLARISKSLFGAFVFQGDQDVSFVVRERSKLLTDDVALLVVDCRSDFSNQCPDYYQASMQRYLDIKELIDKVVSAHPSITVKWALSTSRGGITTSAIPRYAENYFEGVIHTATVSDVIFGSGYGFHKSDVKQFFYHHKDDPCSYTKYSTSQRAAEVVSGTLITVFGGGGFYGLPCNAFTQHGFKGMETMVMGHISELIKTGQVVTTEIR